MEKTGFALTVFAGLFSCVLLAWQQYQGASADWVSGFLCVLWSLLMLTRLMTLTKPGHQKQETHLARKIIAAYRNREEEKRQVTLQQSFGPSFALFLGAGLFYVLWQVVCAAYPANDFALSGFQSAIAEFFALSSAGHMLQQSFVFAWGQGFLFFLSLAMMGFLLRSYASFIPASRIALLVMGGYITAGWIVFLGFAPDQNAVRVEPSLIGMGIQSGFLNHPATLFDKMLAESGVVGVSLLAVILFIPLAFICLSFHRSQPDWVILSVGTMAGLALITSMFFPLQPALGGFTFLCWMAVFLAWGASETRAKIISA